MKKQENFTQFKQYQISSSFMTKINGGDKRATAKSDEEIE
jgi:hypothetical protein